MWMEKQGDVGIVCIVDDDPRRMRMTTRHSASLTKSRRRYFGAIEVALPETQVFGMDGVQSNTSSSHLTERIRIPPILLYLKRCNRATGHELHLQ